MSLILCSHLLRDVEQVCENVIVFNQGKVAARGPIADAHRRPPLRLRRAREGRRGGLPHRPQGPRLRLARGRGRLSRLPHRRPRPRAASSGPRASAACRCATCARARRAWRTCSCAPSATRCRRRCPSTSRRYRRYEAREPLRRVRFWPITREALRLILAKRAFLGLLLAGLGPVPGPRRPDLRGHALPGGRAHPPHRRAACSASSCASQTVFTLLLSSSAGAGLIANDLRTGAILVYLSRPLTRRDYVLGKLGVLLALNLSVTLVPGLLLYLIALALAPDQFAEVGPGLDRRPRSSLHSLVISLVMSLHRRSPSPSLSRSARVAGLGFFGADVRAGDRARRAARGLRPAGVGAPLRPGATCRRVGNALFGITRPRLRAALGLSRARAGRGRASAAWPSCARACARWRSCDDGDRCEYVRALALVRPGDRAQRRHHHRRARRHRPPRSQRRGQVHVPEAGRGPARAQPGRGARARQAGLGLARAVPSRRRLPGGGRVLGGAHRAAVRDRAAAPHRLRRGGVPRSAPSTRWSRSPCSRPRTARSAATARACASA